MALFTRYKLDTESREIGKGHPITGHQLPVSSVYFSECHNIIGDQILLESRTKLCRGKNS
jgi:hypothetical protein